MGKLKLIVACFTLLILTLAMGCSNKSDGGGDGNGGKVVGKLVTPPIPGNVYATWLNVWISSAGSWTSEDHWHGVTVNHGDNVWKSINWENQAWRNIVFKDLVNAGINLVITDNTNGLHPTSDKAFKDIENNGYNLKYCVALGNAQLRNENIMKWVDGIKNNERYFKLDGKPVIIAYVGKNQWVSDFNHPNLDKLKEYPTYDYLKNFTFKWASGEDTTPNKWGWILEPEDGYTGGTESALVSPAVKHTSSNTTYTYWSRSMAFLDYSFSVARMYKPKFIIVGSYDDPAERNGWMTMKTANAISDPDPLGKYSPISGIQIFSPWTGDTSDETVFRRRVEDWIKGRKLEEREGGNLPDGIYRIKNTASQKYLVSDADYTKAQMTVGAKGNKTYDKFALYHIGNEEYRIVNIYTGMPLMIINDMLVSSNWTPKDHSLFSMTEVSDNGYDVWDFQPMILFTRLATSAKYRIKVKGSGSNLEQREDFIYHTSTPADGSDSDAPDFGVSSI